MSADETRRKIAQLLRAAEANARKADQYAERAAVASFEAFRMLKFGKIPLSEIGEDIQERASKAHDSLGDARAGLGKSVYQLERALKRAE